MFKEWIKEILAKKNTWLLSFLDLQYKYAEKVLRYITAVFVITGILKFQPDILLKLAESLGITLQEYWHVLFTFFIAVDLIVETCYQLYRNIRLTASLQSWTASLLAFALVDVIGYDGDRMLLAFAFWWVIKAISLWILEKKNYMITETIITHKARPSIGTAVCVEKDQYLKKHENWR